MTSYTTLYYRCFPSWDAMLLCCEKSRNYRHSWRFQISIGKKLITINKWKCWVYQTFCQLIFESNIRDNNSYSFHSTAAFHPMIESIYSKVHCIHISGWRFKWRFFIRCNIIILKFNWYYFMILMDDAILLSGKSSWFIQTCARPPNLQTWNWMKRSAFHFMTIFFSYVNFSSECCTIYNKCIHCIYMFLILSIRRLSQIIHGLHIAVFQFFAIW